MLWCSSSKAKELGATHYAWFCGIIPGFYGMESGLWVSRSDLLNPIEDFLVWLWVAMRQLRNEEPNFMFAVGKEI